VRQIQHVQKERAEVVKQQEILRQERDQYREKGQESKWTCNKNTSNTVDMLIYCQNPSMENMRMFR